MATFSREEVLKFHQGGKVAVNLPKPLKTKEDLCLAYTPGVALAVKEIAANPAAVFDCTAKSNLVAVVSDGTAILGLGGESYASNETGPSGCSAWLDFRNRNTLKGTLLVTWTPARR